MLIVDMFLAHWVLSSLLMESKQLKVLIRLRERNGGQMSIAV